MLKKYQNRLLLLYVLYTLSFPMTEVGAQIAVAPPPERTLGIFQNGYAQVSEEGETYYINRQGERVSLYNPQGLHWGMANSTELSEDGEQKNRLPKNMFIFGQNERYGIVDTEGNILLNAEYNHIDNQNSQFWKLHKGSKLSLYLPDGTILPFFDDIGYINGDYFDVKQGDTWHIYSKSQGKIITRQAYEGFDYCGGCGTHSPYVYAKKGGKWGIMDWEENVLVPFEYDHRHRHMRSDVWVASFEKNGKPLIVHIPTQQVFDQAEGYELVSGMLIGVQNGKYGAYDRNGEQAVPFVYDKIDLPNHNDYTGYWGDYLIIEQNHQKGLIRTNGDIIIPPSYDNIMVYDDYVVLTKDNQTTLHHIDNNEALLTIENGEITHINNLFYSSGGEGIEVFSVKQKAFYGVYFAKTKRYYEPAYYKVDLAARRHFPDRNVILADRQGALTYFDEDGEPIFPFDVQKIEFVDVRDSSMIAYQAQGQWGVYDIAKRQEVIPVRYDDFFKILGDSSRHLIRASVDTYRSNPQFDLYDRSGNKVNAHTLSAIDEIDDRYYLIRSASDQKDGEYALLDIHTAQIELLPYPHVSLTGSPSVLLVSRSQDGSKSKLYDIFQQKELGDVTYRPHRYASLPVDQLTPDDKTWVLMGFKYGLGQVEGPEGRGLIDEQGQVLIQPQYSRLGILSTEHIMVSPPLDAMTPSRSYFVDRKDQRIFPEAYFMDDMIYYNIGSYELGDKAILMQETDNGILFGLGDLHTGDILIPAEYAAIEPIPDLPYLVLGKTERSSFTFYGRPNIFGLAGLDGKIIVEPKFNNILYLRSSYLGNNSSTDPGSLFPLLVQDGDTWKYMEADGSFLPITAPRAAGMY